MRTRRHFIKTVLLGATAAGLPWKRSAAAEAPAGSPVRSLKGESFLTCHSVRDGQTLPEAEISRTCDVVVIGGGPSGLAAAYELRDRDVLLLEKEDSLGGNCTLDEWEGVRMSTGAAFYTESETDLVAFFREIGAEGRRIEGGDSLVIDGVPYLDFFGDGAKRLPFPQKARDDFRRSGDELPRLLKTRAPEELDRLSFADVLKAYDPLVTRFWDRFGPSNWGGPAVDTSAYIGCEAYHWAGGAQDRRWSFPGGMAGGLRVLAEHLRPMLGERLVTGAAVYRVERQPKVPGAVVRYIQHGAPKAVRGRVVIVATPKFYASRIVSGLPDDQVQAMRSNRYAPYPVFNVCLEGGGPEPAYDNWFLDGPFTDFVPAEWVLHAGRGERDRKTVLTVYHPLPEARRAELLVDDLVLEMADGVASALDRHFPGILRRIAEIRVFRRGHPMYISTPGRRSLAAKAAHPFGPVLFANTDSLDEVSSFSSALGAARAAAAEARRRLEV